MTTTANITRKLINNNQRINHAAVIFGIHFPMRLEPFIYAITDKLANEYNGGHWEFYALSNGGFYMAPGSDTRFHVACENGFEGSMTADALGITACLYAYSHLSFGGDKFAETCAEHYHLLREYMYEHPEVTSILRAVD